MRALKTLHSPEIIFTIHHTVLPTPIRSPLVSFTSASANISGNIVILLCRERDTKCPLSKTREKENETQF